MGRIRPRTLRFSEIGSARFFGRFGLGNVPNSMRTVAETVVAAIQKFLFRLVALGVVAGEACSYKVGNVVRSAAGTRGQMVDGELMEFNDAPAEITKAFLK